MKQRLGRRKERKMNKRSECTCVGSPARSELKCSSCQNAIRRATKMRNRKTRKHGVGQFKANAKQVANILDGQSEVRRVL